MSASLLVSSALMGFVGSTHCVGMCGGIAGALGGRLSRTFAYHVGRSVSYAVLGAIAGGLGAMTGSLPWVRDAQVGLRVASAVLLLVTGLWLSGALGVFTRFERVGAPLWRSLSTRAARLMAAPSLLSGFGLGLLWGLMPCGLIYAALALSATTGSFAMGAATAATFGLGTTPLLVGVALCANQARRFARWAWVRRLAAGALCLSAFIQLQSAHALAESAGASCHGHCASSSRAL